jgi:hypothetical protein
MSKPIPLSCALIVLISGCAELRYRAATNEITYHLGRDNFLSCWKKIPGSAHEQCLDSEAQPDLDACAATLSVAAHSVLVENIRKEIQGCMKQKGWTVGDDGYIVS